MITLTVKPASRMAFTVSRMAGMVVESNASNPSNLGLLFASFNKFCRRHVHSKINDFTVRPLPHLHNEVLPMACKSPSAVPMTALCSGFTPTLVAARFKVTLDDS